MWLYKMWSICEVQIDWVLLLFPLEGLFCYIHTLLQTTLHFFPFLLASTLDINHLPSIITITLQRQIDWNSSLFIYIYRYIYSNVVGNTFTFDCYFYSVVVSTNVIGRNCWHELPSSNYANIRVEWDHVGQPLDITEWAYPLL